MDFFSLLTEKGLYKCGETWGVFDGTMKKIQSNEPNHDVHQMKKMASMDRGLHVTPFRTIGSGAHLVASRQPFFHQLAKLAKPMQGSN